MASNSSHDKMDRADCLKTDFSLAGLLLVLLLGFTMVILPGFLGSANGVSAVANEALLSGPVHEYCVSSPRLKGTSPEPFLYKLSVRVETVEDIGKSANFIRGEEGNIVTLYSTDKLPEVLPEQKIKATVTYQGDERGGLFWIKHLEVMK